MDTETLPAHDGVVANIADAALALRRGMVDRLVRRGVVRSPAIEATLRAVPRHRFLPDVSLAHTYADEAVVLKRSGGIAVSSVSQPTMVASMLEMLDVPRGGRVLEIGTGAGYNAALLSLLVSPDGAVASVEIDGDLAESARARLGELGYSVRVVAGDGRLGCPASEPYSRIIVTAAIDAIPQTWFDQLDEGGMLVVPLSGPAEAVAFVKTGRRLCRVAACPALFIAMQ